MKHMHAERSWNGAPFMANSFPVFFSRTRYTFPTSPLPSILILWKLLGLTSTYASRRLLDNATTVFTEERLLTDFTLME